MAWMNKWFGAEKSATETGLPGMAGASGPVQPARLQIDSEIFELHDVSLRTVCVKPYTGQLIPHQHFEGRLIFQLDNEEHSFSVRGWVQAVSEKDGLVGYYLRPQPFYQRLFAQWLKEWRQFGPRP